MKYLLRSHIDGTGADEQLPGQLKGMPERRTQIPGLEPSGFCTWIEKGASPPRSASRQGQPPYRRLLAQSLRAPAAGSSSRAKLAVSSVPVRLGLARTVSLALATTIAAWAAWSTSAVSAATTSAPSYSAASDGGYLWWSSKVFEVSAEWRVPAISPTSPPGVAATWIGAQSRSDESPFVQVGTVEQSVGPATETYSGFWSDAALGFHSQMLGELAAGDIVRATMVRRGAVWLVTLQDLTSKTTTTHSATWGKGAVFTQAEWLQESPAGATYTDAAAPRFAEVNVNNKDPRPSLANAEALVASNGSTWVPTRFAHDGFSLVSPPGTRSSTWPMPHPSTAALTIVMAHPRHRVGLQRGARHRRIGRERQMVAGFECAEHPLGVRNHSSDRANSPLLAAS